MLKVVIIGERADILPFKAIGAELMEVNEKTDVPVLISNVGGAEEPVLMIMTQELSGKYSKDVDKFREKNKNMFLSVPSVKTEPGGRLEEIRKLVTKSLGVDLLGQKK